MSPRVGMVYLSRIPNLQQKTLEVDTRMLHELLTYLDAKLSH